MGFFDRFKEKEPKLGLKEAGIGLVARGNDFWLSSSGVDANPQNLNLQQQYINAYNNFPVIASAIDITSEQVVQEFYFEGPNSDRLSKLSEEINLQQKFLTIVKHMLINGNLWVEFPNTREMKFLDPRTMTTWRKVTGEVIGHSQDIDGQKKVLWGTTGDISRDGQFKKKSSISKIVHFKYNALAGDKYGNSLLHPVLPLLRIKDQIEQDLRVIVRRYAAPIIHAQVGDDVHIASDTDLTSIQNNLKDIYADTEYVTNHLVKMTILGFEGKALNIDYILKHIDMNIVSGLQVPPELLGIGTSSKSEAEVKLRSFGRHIKSIQMAIKTEFEDNVIIALGLGGINDHLVWGYAEEREHEIEIDILRGLVKDGLITPQKANTLLPPEFHEELPDMLISMQRPIGSPGNPQDQSKFQKGSDKEKDNPTDPTLKQKEVGLRRNRNDRAKPVLEVEMYGSD